MIICDNNVQDVKDNPIMVYMKGVPDFPQCGFSALAVRVLKQYGKLTIIFRASSLLLGKLYLLNLSFHDRIVTFMYSKNCTSVILKV